MGARGIVAERMQLARFRVDTNQSAQLRSQPEDVGVRFTRIDRTRSVAFRTASRRFSVRERCGLSATWIKPQQASPTCADPECSVGGSADGQVHSVGDAFGFAGSVAMALEELLSGRIELGEFRIGLAHPEKTVVVFVNRADHVVRGGLPILRSKDQDFMAIEAVQPVLGAKPHISGPILVDAIDTRFGQAVFDREPLEANVGLRRLPIRNAAKWRAKDQQASETRSQLKRAW